MPTYQRLPRFDQDWESLGPVKRRRFRTAVGRFVEDLEAGRRVKGVQGVGDIMEMTFAPDGTATWQFGAEVKVGQVRVVWRRIDTHHILRSP